MGARSPPMIETARLVLRRARPDDFDAFHVVLSDARAMRYWSSPPHVDRTETERWFAAMIDSPPDQSDDYVIERDGEAIGKAGCWRLPEIGFILHPDHWRQGIAREALTAIIPAIFARHPIPAITADVDPRNAASLALLTGLRFVETGRATRTYEIAGVWADSIYLALPRPP